MNGLFSVIQKMLSGGAGSGIDQFGANASGKIMPQGSSPTGSSFNTGMMHGMSGIGGSGGVSHAMNTKQVDHQLGLSALQQYQDMSQPSFNGMNQFMSLANGTQQQKPQVAAMPPNQYVQALLSGMRGVR